MEVKEVVPSGEGAFVDSLTRTTTQIRKDRAESLKEDAEISYRRKIEDMKTELKRLQRRRRDSLDLSPDDVNSLVAGRDFDGEKFSDKDIKAGIEIRNLKIKIEIAEERYGFLFGYGETVPSSGKSEPGTVE